MDILEDSHSRVFLRAFQALLQQTTQIGAQSFEIDGSSLDIPRVIAVARCSKQSFPPKGKGLRL